MNRPLMNLRMHQEKLTISTPGRGTTRFDDKIQSVVRDSQIQNGLCTVFLAHTSASIILCENADPSVREDLERFFSALVPDGNPLFQHQDEGPDDMPAHVRTILTQNSISIPVQSARLTLGIWQGLYLWEHRTAPHTRRIFVQVQGNASSE